MRRHFTQSPDLRGGHDCGRRQQRRRGRIRAARNVEHGRTRRHRLPLVHVGRRDVGRGRRLIDNTFILVEMEGTAAEMGHLGRLRLEEVFEVEIQLVEHRIVALVDASHFVHDLVATQTSDGTVLDGRRWLVLVLLCGWWQGRRRRRGGRLHDGRVVRPFQRQPLLELVDLFVDVLVVSARGSATDAGRQRWRRGRSDSFAGSVALVAQIDVIRFGSGGLVQIGRQERPSPLRPHPG